MDKAIDRMRFTSASEVHWQNHDRWACQVDCRTGREAEPTHER